MSESQLDWLAYVVGARTDDPPSSHLAARANAEERAAQTRAILVALAHAGRDGCTNDALDALHGWRAGTASRRTAELMDAKRYGDDPDQCPVRRLIGVTRPTRTGSPAHVLVIQRTEAA